MKTMHEFGSTTNNLAPMKRKSFVRSTTPYNKSLGTFGPQHLYGLLAPEKVTLCNRVTIHPPSQPCLAHGSSKLRSGGDGLLRRNEQSLMDVPELRTLIKSLSMTGAKGHWTKRGAWERPLEIDKWRNHVHR